MSLRKTLLLAGVAAALFAFIWFFERRTPSTDEAREQLGRILDAGPEEVSRVECREGELPLWTLVRRTNGWILEGDSPTEADGPTIDGFLRSLVELRSSGPLPEPADRKSLGLDPPDRILVVSTSRGATTFRVGREIEGTGSVAVEIEGEKHPQAVALLLGRVAHLDRSDLRARAIFGRDAVDVVRIEARRQDAPPWILERRGEVWWTVAARGADDLADPERVEKLLAALRDTRVASFGGPRPEGVVHELAFRSASGTEHHLLFEPAGPRGTAGPPSGKIRGEEGGTTFLAESRLSNDLPRDPRALAPMASKTLSLRKLVVRKGPTSIEATSPDGGSTWSVGAAPAQQPVERLLGWLFKGEGGALLPGERLSEAGFRVSEPLVSIELLDRGGATHRVELSPGPKGIGAAWYRARPNASIYAPDRFRGLLEAVDAVLGAGPSGVR